MPKFRTLPEIWKLTFADPDITTEAIQAALAKQGATPSEAYVNICRREFVDIVEFLRERGCLNDNAPAALKKAEPKVEAVVLTEAVVEPKVTAGDGSVMVRKRMPVAPKAPPLVEPATVE